MPEEQPRVEQEKTLFAWKAPARPYKERGKQFLTVPMVIVILVGIILLLAGEWIMIVVISSLMFAYYAWTSVVPETIEFAATTRGLKIDGSLYPWQGMVRWWLAEKWGMRILMVETPMVASGRLTMPVKKEDEKKLVEVMEKYLLREKAADTWLDKAESWVTEKFPLTDKV